MSNSLEPHGLWPTRLLCPRDFPGKNTGAGCHFPLQGIFRMQGIEPASLSSPALAGAFFTIGGAHWMLISLEDLNRKLIHLVPSEDIPAAVQVWDLPGPEMMMKIKIILRRKGKGRGRAGKRGKVKRREMVTERKKENLVSLLLPDTVLGNIHALIYLIHVYKRGFPCGSVGKESGCNAGDLG